MKYIFFTISLLVGSLNSIGQNVDSLGLNADPELNNSEVVYFNTQINKPDSFDFNNKRVGFFYYNNGSNYITKKDYFERRGKEYSPDNEMVMNQLLIFTHLKKLNQVVMIL